jgi:RNA-directed DNA polymerase
LQEEILTETKPFNIPKKVMWQAYKLVKANKGSAGVDQQSLEDFEKDLANNLYKLWNRLSSGSYFPPPVKSVSNSEEIWRRKDTGNTRSE